MRIASLTKRQAQAAAVFSRLQAANPAPTTELEYSSPFELLVAVILSAQATDVGVNKATKQLFPVANTAVQIAALGVEGVIPYIKTIGLYQTKAKNVVAMARIVASQYHGQVPATRQELEQLPGVGRKTANVILNTIFRQPVMAVDTHVFRVANRLGMAPGKSVLAVEQQLLKVIPAEYLLDAHHWLILHGRYVCKARMPNCSACCVNDLCNYYQQTQQIS